MQRQQMFVVKILLQKLELPEEKCNKILKTFIDDNIKYETIINRIEDIYEVNLYLSANNYDDKSISSVIGEMLKKDIPTTKIKKINELCDEHNYTIEEKQRIVSIKSDLYVKSISNIDNRLTFYDDLKIKKEILAHPSRTNYSLRILYARINYLKDTNKYERNKETVYARRFAFENRFGMKDKDLIKKYPLPNKYKMENGKNNKYTTKEKTILNIMFKSMGLTELETRDLINKLDKKNITYEQIKKASDNIKELIDYFKNNSYNQHSINSIIANTTSKHSVSKIIETDTVLINNNYNSNQREKIEATNSKIFNINGDLLNTKIKLIKDENIPKEMISKSRVAIQSLKLTYARIRFLKSCGKKALKYVNMLFREEDRFKNKFGISNKELIKRFPITQEEYKVKTKRIRDEIND